MTAATTTLVAGLGTVSGVVALLATDHRRLQRLTAAVLATAALAVVTAAGFAAVALARQSLLAAIAVAAPGVAIWCAVAATGGRPGALVDPGPSSGGAGPAATRSAGTRARRRQARHTRRYLLLLGACAVSALILAGVTSHLPWMP